MTTTTVRTELKTDAARVWNLYAQHTYPSADLPVVACREALQNSVDAIRKAIDNGEMHRGRFSVTYDPAVGLLAFDDNGIGMDHATLHQVFLTLGGSGKRGQAGATGGFGVAKAVILGCSPTATWAIHSRDNYVPSAHLGIEVELSEQKRPERRGTRIEVMGLTEDKPRYSDRAKDYVGLVDRLRFLLEACDLPDVDLLLNGVIVDPIFPAERGTACANEVDWGQGVKAVRIASFGRVPDTGRAAYFVRVNGLVQHRRGIGYSCTLDRDFVIDIEPGCAPDEDGYPLTTSREQLQGDAHRAYEQFRERVETLAQPPEEGPEFETFDEEDEAGFNEALSAFLADLGEKGQLDAMFAAQAEPATRFTPVGQAAKPPISRAVAATGADVPDWAFEAIADGRADTYTKGIVLAAVEAAVGRAWEPDGGGLAAVVAGDAVRSALGAGTSRRGERLEGAAFTKVSRKNYDAKKAARFRAKPKASLPLLLAWDAACRLIAKASDESRSFRPGFVLDDTVRAMASQVNGRRYLLVNPDWLMRVVDENRAKPSGWTLVAACVHIVACHELAHLPRMDAEHDERYAIARETIGLTSVQVLPAVERVCAAALKAVPRAGDSPDYLDQLVRGVRLHIEASREPGWAQVRHWTDAEIRAAIGRRWSESSAIKAVAVAAGIAS